MSTTVHEHQFRLEHVWDEGPEDGSDADHSYLRLTEPPAYATGSFPIHIVDLFAGCGGLTLGALEGARRSGRGAQLALAVDSDTAPLGVLRKTLGEVEKRISTSDLGTVLAMVGSAASKAEKALFEGASGEVLLLAGPPCQGHSTLNNHTRHDDPRNDLYLAVARAAELLKPRAVIVENVRSVAIDRRSAMLQCAARLKELGYAVSPRRLDLHLIGVPQTRVRHVLVATKKEAITWDLLELPGRTVQWAIDDLLDTNRETDTMFDTASTPHEDNHERIEWLFMNDEYDLPNDRRPECHQDTDSQKKHSYVSMYGRMKWDAPAQTVTSGFGSMGQGRYVHPLRRRTLTPHEAARLQFLPDFVQFGDIKKRTALAQMIGNVAPPRLTIAIVEALVRQDLL